MVKKLPMQVTQVQSLVQKDPTQLRATKPMLHNYRARVPQLPNPTHLKPMLCTRRSRCNEKLVHGNREEPMLDATRESPAQRGTPSTAKNKSIKLF